MPLSIEQIISVAAPHLFASYGVPYEATPVFQLQNEVGNGIHIFNPRTYNQTTVRWTGEEEWRLRNEAERITFVRDLVVNAIENLMAYEQTRPEPQLNFNFTREQQSYLNDVWGNGKKEPEQEVIDVDFSEEE